MKTYPIPTRLNEEEIKLIDEASASEKRSRSAFISYSSVERAKKIMEVKNGTNKRL